MHLYSAFGLTLASALPLPELEAGRGGADVHVALGPGSEPIATEPSGIRCLHASPSTALLRWGGVGELLIEEGKRITVHPSAPTDQDSLQLFVLGAGLGVLLHQRGLLVLHGGGVAVANCGVGFVGGKGWGKSTTVMALHRRGHPLISDELLVVRLEDSLAAVVPGPPPIKLWADAVSAMIVDPEMSTPVRPGADKYYVGASSVVRECLNLDRLFLLDKGDVLGIESVPRSEAFFALIPHVYVSRFGTQFLQSTSAARTFRQIDLLLQRTSVLRLLREQNLSRLDDIARLVEANLTEEGLLFDCNAPQIS